jgi:hypothetical protein
MLLRKTKTRWVVLVAGLCTVALAVFVLPRVFAPAEEDQGIAVYSTHTSPADDVRKKDDNSPGTDEERARAELKQALAEFDAVQSQLAAMQASVTKVRAKLEQAQERLVQVETTKLQGSGNGTGVQILASRER